VSSPLLPNPFDNDRLTEAGVFDPALDVTSVHQQASTWLEQAIERAAQLDKPDGKAKIAILQSTPGFGKTHVVGRVGHRCGNGLLVFVPQMEEHGSSVKHVHWHVLNRLFGAPSGQRPLLHSLLARLVMIRFGVTSTSCLTRSRSSTSLCASVSTTGRKPP
jgi:DNA segregation ATPase FtsK/SpoIIIE, S-DNA-T family